MKAKLNVKNTIAYLQGNFRYWLYYSRFFRLMRVHIYEQIKWRVEQKMERQCYDNGSCKLCGCDTIKLQMANKACPKPCYPEMMNKKEWKSYKVKNKIEL